eukprot:jgi/Galph1/2565/GphlegSOOS_G1237.1
MEADSENFPAPNIETLEPCSKETLESHHEETTNMESANIFNFEVSDSLRESIFSSLAQTSLIDAADFEFRTHPSFLKILNEIDGTCRSDLLEKSKLVSLRLSLTRATLFGQLGTAFNTHPVSFKQVAFYSSRSPISDICEAMQAFFQGNSVTEYSLFVEVEDKDFSEILESIAALFRKTSNLTFLYIELDPFLPPKNWNALLQSFQVLASLKYFAMKSLFISNEQLLRLFRLLNKLSTNVICAILDRQWFKENFSNVLQFCQRKKIELKAQFRELSLHLQSDSAMPFTPIWKISLTNLNIGFNNIDTEGAKYLSEALRENTTLTGLNIGWNNIGTEGAKYLSEALRENTTLTILDIDGNNIGTEGAKYLSGALRENTTLTTLDINHTCIGTEGAEYLSKALRENTTLTTLDISYNNIGTEGAKYLSEALRENTTLTSLDIGWNNIGTECAKYLSEALRENTTLTTLNIDHNNIETEGAEYLSEALRENTTLTTLDIRSNNIDAKGAEYLSEALRENTTLTNLNIDDNDIETEGTKYLSEALRENTTLTSLNVRYNNIDTEGAKYLSEAMRENTALTSLYIDGNNIGTEGAKYLSEALRENTTLTTLDISYNNIGTEGAKYMSGALRENKTLTTLDISYNNIGTEGAKYMSEALRENTTLMSLYIGENKIDSKGAKYLSKALRENTTLMSLYIGENKIDSKGAKYLSKALRENTTLTSLDIRYSNIDTEGAKYLSEALRENTTLTSFDIDHNKIGTEGAKFIVEISKYLNRNISKRNGENISNASVVTAPAANSTLKLDPQRMRNSLEYLISVDQTFIVYRYTHLKESTLLFILYMQSRRMQMHLFPSVSYCLYSPLANLNYFILDDSKHMEMRKEPHYFEPNQFTCVICHNICISPYASENCIHAFCQTCIEQWGQKSCPTCRTACKEWKPSVLVEHLILQLQLQCPFECGWKGTFSEYNTSHQLKCPNKVGKCSLCHLPMKQLEFFDLHYRNCHYGLVPCDYCHHDVPFPLLAAHVAHECVLAPSTCGACGYCFSTWQSMISHVDNECVKVVEKCRYYDCGCTKYIERGLLSKHELEAMKEHVYLVKQNMTVRQDKVTEGRTKRRKAGQSDGRQD